MGSVGVESMISTMLKLPIIDKNNDKNGFLRCEFVKFQGALEGVIRGSSSQIMAVWGLMKVIHTGPFSLFVFPQHSPCPPDHTPSPKGSSSRGHLLEQHCLYLLLMDDILLSLKNSIDRPFTCIYNRNSNPSEVSACIEKQTLARICASIGSSKA